MTFASKLKGIFRTPTNGSVSSNGAPSESVRVRVHRSDAAAPETFDVPRFEPMMALDLLLAIQREQDTSIGFRYSCRVGMCGTCTVRVDGRPALACQTRIQPDQHDVEIAPLAGLPVVRDLIVDMTPFYDEWKRVTPWVVPEEGMTEPAQVRPDSPERKTIDPSLDCIMCGACYAGCGIAGYQRDFLGPAALNRAMVLIADSRDTKRQERLERVTGGDGAFRCRYMHICTSVCPKGLDPSGAIRKLRRWRIEGLDGGDA